MGDISDIPTTILNLEVPFRLYVEGTAEFPQGSTQDSLKTKLLYSDPTQDLDVVGHGGVQGVTGTSGMKFGTDNVAMYADGLPVATVNGDRFSCTWVENDENGLKGNGGYTAYNSNSTTIYDGTGGSTTLSGDTMNVGKLWGKYGNMDIATDQGDLGVGHGGLRLAPNTVEIFDGSSAAFNASIYQDTLNIGKVWGRFANTDIATDQGDLGVGHGGVRLAPNVVELFDGSLNEWNAQLNNNVLAVTTVSGPSADKGGGANILYLKGSQGGAFPDAGNAGMRIANNLAFYDGTDNASHVLFQNKSILSSHACYGFLQESALGSFATGNIVWGPPGGTGTLSVLNTPDTLTFNLATGNIDGMTPSQNGIYRVKACVVANLINASIEITINGVKAVNSATAGANFLQLVAQWTGFLNAGDIVRVFVVTATVAKDGATFEMTRMDGCITDVVSNGASLGPV